MNDDKRMRYEWSKFGYDEYLPSLVAFGRRLAETDLGDLVRLAAIGHPGCKIVLDELRAGELGPVLAIAEALS